MDNTNPDFKTILWIAYQAAALRWGGVTGYGTVESPSCQPNPADILAEFHAWYGEHYDPAYAPAPLPKPLGAREGQFVVFWGSMIYRGGWGCYNSFPRSYDECVELREQIKGHPSRWLNIVRYYQTESQSQLHE